MKSPRLRSFPLIAEDVSSGLKSLSGQDKAQGNMQRADVRNGGEPPHLNPPGPLVLQGHRLDIPTWRKHYWTGAELKSSFLTYTHSNQPRRYAAFIHSTQMFSLFIFLSPSPALFPPSFVRFFLPGDEGRVPEYERARERMPVESSHGLSCLKQLSIA